MAENFTTPNPRLINNNGKSLIKTSKPSGPTITDTILDRDWAKAAFLMADAKMTDTTDRKQMTQAMRDDLANRYWSSASRKFTDTQIGGNTAVNPRPQFTPYSDIRVRGRLTGRTPVKVANTTGNHGMGRYYSEAIDDNAQTVYLRFGVPQYNSLFSYFKNAFNPGMSTFINTGRAQSWAGVAAEALGTFFTWSAFPVASLIIVGSRFIGSFFGRHTSKFYTMKPTMPLYWTAVDMMVNAMVVNRGLMPKLPGGSIKSQRIGDPTGFDDEFVKKMHEDFPRFFSESGRVDVYAIALRAQRTANKLFKDDYDNLKQGDAESFVGYVRQDGADKRDSFISYPNGEYKLGAILARMAKTASWFSTDKDKIGDGSLSEASPKLDPKTGKPREGLDGGQGGDDGWGSEFLEFLDAELSDGGAFAVFRVDNTGSTSESFSNAIMESDVSQKINSASSQSRQINFSFAGGNIGDDIVSNTIETMLGGVKEIATGALRGITLGLSSSVDAALSGSYFDIPKTWQSSSANLPRASYTMQLICPYGHPMSQLQNIYIPLSMVLAGALPRSTGKQTYGSPFLCQVFDRGRCQIRLGMIESVSISRGTSNLNFTNKGQALAIDVSIDIVDLSSIMHMPIGTGGLWKTILDTAQGETDLGPHMDEDNILMDYLAVIGGLDIYNQLYTFPKARLKAAHWLMGMGKYSSPAWAAMAFHDSATSGILQWFTLGGIHVLEGMARGNDNIGDRN